MLVLLQIADFGLARDLEDEQYYVARGGQVPVKWTAPEVCTPSIMTSLPLQLISGSVL